MKKAKNPNNEFIAVILFSMVLTAINYLITPLGGWNLIITALFVCNLDKMVMWYEKRKNRH